MLRIPIARTRRQDRKDLTVMTDECSDSRGGREPTGPDTPAIDTATVVTQPQKQSSRRDQANKQKVIL